MTFVNSDYDMKCTPALVKIAADAKQPVPDWLQKSPARGAQARASHGREETAHGTGLHSAGLFISAHFVFRMIPSS